AGIGIREDRALITQDMSRLTVARWRILRFPLSESTLNFRIFLFNRTGCLCEVIHIRRVDGGAL
ncbi:hypothetical protein, partial [Escherichia coli]|uniref:hypothetical protein n=1 Tax=Escherichia coli TaxID=562 RepID=UPI001BD22E48